MRVLARLLYFFFAINRRIVRSLEYRMPAGFVCNLHLEHDRRAAAALGAAADQIALDVGAGAETPFLRFAVARPGTRVIALDVAAEELAANTDAPLKIVADCGRSLPIRSGAADIVTARSFLEHLADTEAFIAECARVLKPKGAFFAVFPCRHAPFAIINRMLPNRFANVLLRLFQPGRAGALGFPAYYDRLSYTEIERMLAAHGLALETAALRYYQSTYYDFFLPLYVPFVLYDLAVFALGRKNLCCQMMVVARRRS